MVNSPPCVFDRILAREADAHWVLDGPEVAAFLDARPVFKGHTVVVPRQHIETVADLEPELLCELVEAGKRVAAAQQKAIGSDGTLFLLNDVVSQSVPHVHLHVIPRRRKDGLRGFMWPRTRYDNEEEAEDFASVIRAEL
ncbi:MAG TPA: HIT family protein [Acidimicrobiales bacterium]|nr:HIT family protein [Acidimicrobiales bacterium]